MKQLDRMKDFFKNLSGRTKKNYCYNGVGAADSFGGPGNGA